MNPYASTSQIDHPSLDETVHRWPRVIDALCWLYPLCFAMVAFGTTIFLRSSSISISPMQYDVYFEKAGPLQQFWYHMTLLLLVLSPPVILGSFVIQLALPGRPPLQRLRSLGLTLLVWLFVIMFFAIANVPILDYLID